MEEIKRLKEMKYKIPQMCTEKGCVAEIFNQMFLKIDELIEQVNELKRKQELV